MATMTDELRWLMREYGSDLGPLRLTQPEFEHLKRVCEENGDQVCGSGPFVFCGREIQIVPELRSLSVESEAQIRCELLTDSELAILGYWANFDVPWPSLETVKRLVAKLVTVEDWRRA